jgi:hypothetical protein
LDLRAALKLGIHLGLDDIRADEFYAMLNFRSSSIWQRGSGGRSFGMLTRRPANFPTYDRL